MAAADLLSPEYLRQLINYDPETGRMTWLPRTPDMFLAGQPGMRRARTPEHKCRNWNAKLAGKPALATVDMKNGAMFGNIARVPVKAHRVAWAIFHGRWPEGVVDHINGNAGDNRISNLRDVPQIINMRNCRRASNNTSGYAGVSWFAQTKRWHVRVPGYNGSGHVGFFKSLDDAVAARDQARSGMGFTGRGDG